MVDTAGTGTSTGGTRSGSGSGSSSRNRNGHAAHSHGAAGGGGSRAHSSGVSMKWYYLDSQKRKRGPLSTSAIEELLRSECIKIDSYVWNTEMCMWKRACQVAPLQDVILRSASQTRQGGGQGGQGGRQPTTTTAAGHRKTSKAAANAAAAAVAVWYYLDAQRRQRGPVSAATLQAFVSSGSLKPRSYIWRKGFLKWRPLNEVPEMRCKGGGPTAKAKTKAKAAAPDPAAPKLHRFRFESLVARSRSCSRQSRQSCRRQCA